MSPLHSNENQEVGRRLLDLLRQIKLRTEWIESTNLEIEGLCKQKIYTLEAALELEKEISRKKHQIDITKKAIRGELVRVCIIMETLGIEI